MKNITVSDMTLVLGENKLSFKEKIEVARYLDNLGVDVIDMPQIINEKADTLLIRTVSSFVKKSIISVSADVSLESVQKALNAVKGANNVRVKLCVPVSTVAMEYTCHKKPAKLLDLCSELIGLLSKNCKEIEIFAIDATRMDLDFMKKLVEICVNAGVSVITVCDDEGIMLPDEISDFILSIKKEIPLFEKVKMGIMCKNTNDMAVANSLMSIKSGVDEVKVAVGYNEITQTKKLASILNNCGKKIDANISLNGYELNRIVSQIEWVLGVNKAQASSSLAVLAQDGNNTPLDKNDSIEVVSSAVKGLGYDLSEEDYKKVYEEFIRVAGVKTVGMKELDAIVASVALQVVPTYVLKSFMINNGNIISSSAQITLEKNGKEISGVCMGDGPIDAAFKALEQIIGTHFELDDFQIQSVTEGREAMGFALVKLRYDGKLYSGNGLSTDIIGSSIRAYINAVNKIVYEEN